MIKFGVLSMVYLEVFVAAVNCVSDVRNASDDSSVGRQLLGMNALQRLSPVSLPMMFGLGMILTMLMALSVMSIKNMAMGVMMLIMSISQAVARIFAPSAAPVQRRAVAAPRPTPGPLPSTWPTSDYDAVYNG